MMVRFIRNAVAFWLLSILVGCAATSILGSGEAVLPKPVELPAIEVPPSGQMPAPMPLVVPKTDSQANSGDIPTGHKGDPKDPNRCKSLGIPDNKIQGRNSDQVKTMQWAKKQLSPGGKLEGFPLTSNNIEEMLKFVEKKAPAGGWEKGSEAVLFDILFVRQNSNEVFRDGGCHNWPSEFQSEMDSIEKFIWELQLPIA